MNRRSKIIRVVLPLAIVIAGGLILLALVKFRHAPQQKEQAAPGALVHLLALKPVDHQVEIGATGTVQANEEVSIIPQVGGRVVRMAPNLVVGGFFKKGELLFALEEDDYRLQVERARAGVAQAEFALAAATGRARVARQEWEQLGSGEEPASPLVLHQPQLQEARANMAAAQANLRQAELDLSRTVLTAPFNCRIRSEQIAPGQYLKSGNPVAVVAASDSAEIIVPLPLEEMAWLMIPGTGRSNGPGSAATVSLVLGGERYQWQGRLRRTLGELDEKGRMARVVVGVANPYGQAGKLDLAGNLFVAVRLTGPVLRGVFAIPRSALREKNTVWLMDKEQNLAIRPVSVRRLERDLVLVDGGLKEGEQLVLTYLSGAAEGMRLRSAQGADKP